MVSRITLALVAVIVVLAGVACEPTSEVVVQPEPAAAFVKHFVAIGDDFTAGVQSGALSRRLQFDSYPALLSRAFSIATFDLASQPLVQNPGYPIAYPIFGAGFYALERLSPPTIARVAWQDPSLASANRRADMHDVMETNRGTPFPFRNLGIPGGFAFDVLNARDSTTTWTGMNAGAPNHFADVVLRPDVLGPRLGTAVRVLDQAIDRAPLLVTVWLGRSEIHYAAALGTPDSLPYDAAGFQGYLDTIVDSLQTQTGANVVLANIPLLETIPWYTLQMGVVMGRDGEPVPHPTTGDPIPLLGEGTAISDLQPGITEVPSGTRVTAAGRVALERGAGIPDVVLVAWIMEDDGVDEPTATGLLDERYPDHGQPLSPMVTLTPGEWDGLLMAVDGFNAAIGGVAGSRGAPLVDMTMLFRRFVTDGIRVGGVTFTGATFLGGIYSLDGLTPTSYGYAAIAQTFIDVINEEYDAGVPPVEYGTLINPPLTIFDF